MLTKGHEHYQCSWLGLLKVSIPNGSTWPHPVLNGILEAGTCGKNRRVLGSDSCKLLLLGKLLIKMSLCISWTPLIHPRNLYIHSLIHCVLQRLSPVIHVCMFGLELHQAGFHLSQYVVDIGCVRGQL